MAVFMVIAEIQNENKVENSTVTNILTNKSHLGERKIPGAKSYEVAHVECQGQRGQ